MEFRRPHNRLVPRLSAASQFLQRRLGAYQVGARLVNLRLGVITLEQGDDLPL